MERGWVLWRVGAEPHLWVVELNQMVTGINTGDEVCGRRGSVVLEFLARVFGRRSWWWLRVRGEVLSTLVCSSTGCSDRGRGVDMTGGRKLTAPADSTATRCKRGRGEAVSGETAARRGRG